MITFTLSNKTKMITDIIKYFNINMFSVSKYTEIPINTLKSLSAKRRPYNITLLNKLLLLYKALLLKTPVNDLLHTSTFLNTEKEDTILNLQQQLKKVTKQIVTTKRKLNKTKEKRQILLRGLNACNVLLQENKEQLTKDNISWIFLRKKHLEQKLKEISLHKEVLLTAKLEGLKAQLKCINKA